MTRVDIAGAIVADVLLGKGDLGEALVSTLQVGSQLGRQILRGGRGITGGRR